MRRFTWLLALAGVLCFSGAAYATALTTTIDAVSATAKADTTFTNTFVWRFNADNAALSTPIDTSKCIQPTTITFDASETDTSSDAKYTYYACDSASSTRASGCVLQGSAQSEHSSSGWMLVRDFTAFYPQTPPTSTDVARITLTCASEGYVYDNTTSAWVEADAVSGTDDEHTPNPDSLGFRGASVYFNDFIYGFSSLEPGDDVDITNEWTAVDVGTVTEDPSVYVDDDAPNGVLQINTDATVGDGMSLLLNASTTNGHALVPAAGRTIYAEFRIKSSDISAQHFFVGLNETSAAAVVATAGTMNASLEYAGFHHEGAVDTAGIPALTVAGGNNTQVESTPFATITAQADATYQTYGVKIVGVDKVYYYIGGTLVGANLAVDDFTAPLYPAIAAVNDEAADDLFDVDYVYVTQTR